MVVEYAKSQCGPPTHAETATWAMAGWGAPCRSCGGRWLPDCETPDWDDIFSSFVWTPCKLATNEASCVSRSVQYALLQPNRRCIFILQPLFLLQMWLMVITDWQALKWMQICLASTFTPLRKRKWSRAWDTVTKNGFGMGRISRVFLYYKQMAFYTITRNLKFTRKYPELTGTLLWVYRNGSKRLIYSWEN